MARISKKELKKKLTELEKKVSELGREKFPEELPEDTKEQIRGIIRSETEKLSNDIKQTHAELVELTTKVYQNQEGLKKLSSGLSQTQKDLKTTDAQLVELTGKVQKFTSLSREVTKTVFQEIENKLKEALGEDFFEEKPEETVAVESEQQEVAEGDYDST